MILAYHGTSFISWWIRMETWSDVSHLSKLMSDDTEIEAWRGGVQRNKSWGILHKKGTIVDVYDLKPEYKQNAEQIKKMEDYFLSRVGKKYDYWGLFRFLPIVRFFKRKPDEDRDFCSELTKDGYEVGDRILINKPAYQCSPEDVISSTLLRKVDTWVVGETLPVAKIDMSRFPIAFA